MKLFMPKQHGAWAMLIIPFWLGAAASEMIWQHVPFFIGWLLLYLGTYPLLLMFKRKKIPFYRKWAFIYMIPALVFLMVPLLTTPSIVYFGFSMVPFFMLNAYFSAKNKDRALMNDLSAIVVFSIAGLASSYLPGGTINEEAILVFAASILFFTGSTFYVKTMIREKKNANFKWISWSYHLLVPILWLAAGEAIVAIAAIPSLIRAVAFYGKPVSVMKVGIYEIVNAALFFIIMLFAL
ncbi:YwiC-like family protein [Mesobacillus subterraneus]|uniref:YwiC-like family protein n=1 Tax=Mesobacillus subterraneus TaxID=285983 RepID=UPI0020400EBF|nr:YwiC-like family protein [Mesobacillus subterraneus]MCM3663006.1 YwiC-like family protein [Mesobacillus subterraneus]MCM3682818.1 YwiC-like family protein [Mesobacillus subterraneus]